MIAAPEIVRRFFNEMGWLAPAVIVVVILGFLIAALLNSSDHAEPQSLIKKAVLLQIVKDGEPTKHHCSGAILSDGRILTAAHCDLRGKKGKKFRAVYSDGSIRPVKIIKERFRENEGGRGDLMLLKVQGGHPLPAYAARPYCSDVALGEKVMVVGHPMHMRWAVTHGYVVTVEKRALEHIDDVWLTHTAESFAGMSGGPVFDEEGRLVGITSHGRLGRVAMRSTVKTGFNFAVDGPEICDFLRSVDGSADA